MESMYIYSLVSQLTSLVNLRTVNVYIVDGVHVELTFEKFIVNSHIQLIYIYSQFTYTVTLHV